jgi:formylglycine-generating enzyme required for sulfatase activity
LVKTKLAIVPILVFLAAFIVGLGVYRMYLPNYRDVGERLNEAHYLTGVAYLEVGQFDQAVSEFSQVALDYRDAEDKLAQALDGSMVYVPAGEFIMGNDAGDPDQRPQRRVYLDAFEIDKYEVTNVQYRHFIQATGWEAPQIWPGRYVQFTD